MTLKSRLKDTLTCDELTRLEQRFHLSDYRLRVHITLPYGEHELDKADSDHIYAVECSSSSASPSRRRIANNSPVSSSSSSSGYDESLRQLNYSQHLLDRSKSHYLAIASNSAHLIACCCPVVKRPKVKVIPQSTLRQPSPNRKPPQSPSTGSPSAALAKGFSQSMNPRIEIRQSPERQAASAPSSPAQSGGNRSGIQVGSKGNSPSLPVSKSSSSSSPHSTSPTGILGGGRRRSSHSPPNDNGASAALNTSISSTSSVSSRSRPQPSFRRFEYPRYRRVTPSLSHPQKPSESINLCFVYDLGRKYKKSLYTIHVVIFGSIVATRMDFDKLRPSPLLKKCTQIFVLKS